LECELDCDLNSVQLQKADRALPDEVGRHVVRHEWLGGAVGLQVVPTAEADPLGQILQLVGEAALLDDAALGDAHLAQTEVVAGLCDAELVQSQHHHLLRRCLLVHQQVFALLIRSINLIIRFKINKRWKKIVNSSL